MRETEHEAQLATQLSAFGALFEQSVDLLRGELAQSWGCYVCVGRGEGKKELAWRVVCCGGHGRSTRRGQYKLGAVHPQSLAFDALSVLRCFHDGCGVHMVSGMVAPPQLPVHLFSARCPWRPPFVVRSSAGPS